MAISRKTKRRLAVSLSLIIVFTGLELSFANWKKQGIWSPNYEKIEISGFLDKAELTEVDYEVLYSQTGLTKLGIDGLLASDRKDKILQIQELYFSVERITYHSILPYVAVGYLDGYGVLCALEDGDIIVSAC